jgi:sigma-B regulation protein RsbU (phosphoserine phosphatase)
MKLMQPRERGTMAIDTTEDIRKGLTETRENLDHWIETTPEAKRYGQCCAEDDTCVRQHMQVIDESLEKIQDGSFGVCEICHEAVDDALLRMDYTSTVCLGHFSEEELRQLESELELSQVVQRGLLPQAAPRIPGLTVAAFSRPAQIVSGDYFDFVEFSDGDHGIVMADVSGHGVSAGMLISSLQTAFQTLAPTSASPLDVLERINHLYAHNIKFTTFVTVFFGKFEPSTRKFRYANAGHTSAYLQRAAESDVEMLHPTGPAIGLMEGFAVRAAEVQLQQGDTLVLYTDGATEATNEEGAQYSMDNLAKVIGINRLLAPEQLIQKVVQDVTAFTKGSQLADDLTLIAARVL